LPEYQSDSGPDLASRLLRENAALAARVTALEGRRPIALDRVEHTTIPAPYEGQFVIELDDTVWYYSNSTWRPVGERATYVIKVVADADLVVVGDGQFIFVVTSEDRLDGLRLIGVAAYVTTVSSSGLPTVQIRKVASALDLLSTKVSIDVSEHSSDYAATSPVINSANSLISLGDRIAIDVDIAGTGTQGLGVVLSFGNV